MSYKDGEKRGLMSRLKYFCNISITSLSNKDGIILHGKTNLLETKTGKYIDKKFYIF